jgi:hypothetical protein
MNKLLRILTGLVLFLASFSCSEEFLVREPMGSNSENIFYSEKGIDALLTGTYSMVRGSALWEVTWGASVQNWIYGSVASDDAYKGSENTDTGLISDIERWETTASNANVEDKWKWAFGMGITRANLVLKVIGKSKDLPVEKAIRCTAEARFLRAFFNFEAWLVFGEKIPVITGDTRYPAKVSNNNPKGTLLECLIKDLKFAWENLPETQEEVGRPTKYAAMALAARAYLQELNYAEAKPLLDQIINSGKYQLMPYYFDNYRIEKENNVESIFEIQANVNDINESLNAEMGIGLNFPHGSDIGMCCGFHQPSQNLANAFKVDATGLPLFDTFNNSDLKNDQGIRSDQEFIPAQDLLDPRIDWTMGRRGIPYLDWGICRGNDWIRYQRDGGPYMPCMKPFFYKSQRYTLSTKTGWQSGVNANNYRYIRYAHILLWRAEVAAFEGDLVRARDLVNLIRDRADNELVMGKVKIFRLPKSVYPWGNEGDIDWSLPAANYKIAQYPPFTDKELAMRAVQWELRLEFATEGQRFFDLRRWDKLPKGMRVDMAATLNAFARGDERIRTIMKGANFTEKAKFMPVPQSQIDMQPGVLMQNEGYR